MVHGTNMPDVATFPSLAEVPVYVRFREHHCINPARPVPTGGTEDVFDDGLLNGYFPRSFDYQHVGNTLRISVPGVHNQVLRYEDYVEGKPNSHDSSKCTACIFRAEQEEMQRHERAAQAANMTPPPDVEMGDAHEAAVDDDENMSEEPSGRRGRRGSTSSVDSDVSYFFGDESDPASVVRSRHMMLQHDPDAEALLDEMMSEGLPDFYDGSYENECNGIQDIIITGEVRRGRRDMSLSLTAGRSFRRSLAMAKPGITTAFMVAYGSGTASSSSSASRLSSLPLARRSSVDTW